MTVPCRRDVYYSFHLFPKQEVTPCRDTESSFLPATLIFSSATKLGTAVVELLEFVPVPLMTRLSTFDSSFPMRCKILSSNTARVFFRSVKENANSLKRLWLLPTCLATSPTLTWTSKLLPRFSNGSPKSLF